MPDAPSPRSRVRGLLADTTPLQSPHFKRLWLAGIVTIIGSQITVITVPAQLWALTQDSAMVGLAGLFGLVPLVIFGLWGGAIADSFDRRTVLMFTTVGLILTMIAFALQAFLELNNIWVILTIFAIQQGLFGINSPTRTALLPSIVPVQHLPAANSLNMTIFQAGAIVGPLVGGALLPLLGFGWLYALDVACLFTTLWAVIKLPSLKPQGEPVKPNLGAILEGFRYTWVHKILLASFLVDLIAMVFGMPRALYPEIANKSFGGPIDGGMEFALLSAALAVGGVLGGVFSGWVTRVQRHGLATLVCIAVWGFAVVGFGLSTLFAHGSALPMLIFAIAFLAVGGAADMASAAFRQTILQSSTNDAIRGRLQGVFIVVVAGGPRVADVLHGWAGSAFGAPIATIAGGVLVVVGIAAAAVAWPQFRRYRPVTAEV